MQSAKPYSEKHQNHPAGGRLRGSLRHRERTRQEPAVPGTDKGKTEQSGNIFTDRELDQERLRGLLAREPVNG